VTLTPPLAATLAAGLLLAAAAPLHAQTAPDAGNLLRDAERKTPVLPAGTPPVPAPAPTTAAPAAGPRVTVRAFAFTGATLLPDSDLQARVAPWLQQPASLADLRRAADAVADLYRERGYLARTVLAEQALDAGVVTIAVLEGRLSGVRVDRTGPVRHIGDERVVAMMTSRQAVGAPVRPDDLQRAIALVDALPGVSASSVLEPGDRPGESRLVVAVKDQPRYGGQAQLDNSGSRASGEWRVSGGVSVASPAGIGDQLQFYGSKSRGSDYLSAAYGAPLGSDGARGGLNTSRLGYGYDLSGSRYTGHARVLGATVSYPFIKRQDMNLQASLGHDRKRFDNAVAGVEISRKTLKVNTLGLAGDVADAFFGGGITQFGLTFTSGRLDLAGNASDLQADQVVNGPLRQGSYRKAAWSLGRLQRITAADTLAVTLAGQRAGRNLDSSEKFGASGQGGVRAYSPSEPSADDGTLATVEWRHQVAEQLTLAAFHETARLRRDHAEHGGTLAPNAFRLAGHGLGLSWGRASDLLVRVAVAWREGGNPVRNAATGADSDGTRRDPRAYVSLLKTF